MSEAKFDTSLRDSQGTEVTPISPENFDFDAYQDYEAALLEGNKKFTEADSGLLVYRRVRPMVFFMTNAGITRNL